jgi:hypothetical protein
VGALIGTVLTLGYSLSIIPIQRAAEIYTPSIVRLFREAPAIRFPFVALLSLCLLSFASVLSPIVGITPTDTIPVLIVFLGVALDLVRQLFRSVTHLLEPKEAVWRLELEAREKLQRLHRKLERAADLSWRALPAEKQSEYTRENYLKFFYTCNPVHDRTVESRSAELTEIAQKAIERADLTLAHESIDALRQLAIDSIEIRKSALTYTPVDLMVLKANAETQLDRIYENLLAVNRTGIRRGLDNVSMWVIRTLGAIAQHMLAIRLESPFDHLGSVATSPIAYCKMAIRDAMTAGMDDAGYEGAATLAAVSKVPRVTAQDVHLLIVDGIFQILRRFITSPGKAVHVNEPLTRGLEVLHALCEREDSWLDHVMRSFLAELQALVPVATALETKQFGELLHLPLAPAFDVSVESSLPSLVQRSTTFVKQSGERPWINPWSDFLKLGDRISGHFRNLSKNPGLAASQMMFYLIRSLQRIAQIYLQQILRARRERPKCAQEIEVQLKSYLSFFWSSGQNAGAMSLQWTENATKCLGCIGLAALNEGLDETSRSALGNIASVTKAAGEKIPNVGGHELARLLMPLRLMKELATEIGTAHLLLQLQTEEEKALTDLARYPDLKEILDRCEREWLRELAQGTREWLLDSDDPEALLMQILNQRARDAANSSVPSSAVSEPGTG